MEACLTSFKNYFFRSFDIGEKRLPIKDISLCDQFAIIGGGIIWNIYFALFAILLGFFAALAIGIAMSSSKGYLRRPARGYVFLFRSSPLFIQFFIIYQLFILLPRMDINIPLGITTINFETAWFTRAWLGGAIVLFLNTTAYSAQLFNSAYRAIPKTDLAAADAYAITGWRRFKRIILPTLLRLAWPAYTNEAIFLFQATALVYFSSFPVRGQQGDGMYYAQFLAEKTYNPFVSYPIAAFYFVLCTLMIIAIYGIVNNKLNAHLTGKAPKRPSLLLQLIR